MAHYPDMASGRFWVIADFEQIKHFELFHVQSHSGQAISQPDPTGGVGPTGKRCLKVTLFDPLDALVISNAQAQAWSLRRDWRDFHLLIGSVYCPDSIADLKISIQGGPRDQTARVDAQIRLHRGWNVLRLDLADAADRIPIDEVRQVSFSLPNLQKPTTLRFDDLVLVDNRQNIFGDPQDPDPNLFVQQRGRRWHIGAAGRFELGFANGQIVHWYDLGPDPQRLNNLVGPGVLGPSPVVLPGIDENPMSTDGFGLFGDTVIAHQQLLEANRVRIVVACTLYFVDAGQMPEADTPFQRWTYTILASGQIYVEFTSTTHQDGFQPQDIGLVVSRVDDGSIKGTVHGTSQLQDPEPLRHVTYGVLHPAGVDRSGLVLVMHDARRSPDIRLLQQSNPPLVNLLASGGLIDADPQTWACLLGIWPPGSSEPSQAQTQALDYCFPAQLDIKVGRLITDTLGDRNHDGFNERHGTYTLAPQDDLLRFQIDARQQPRICPVFNVQGTQDRQVWVYHNNLIVQNVARDAHGDLLFQLPQTLNHIHLFEVVVRNQTANASP